MNYLIFSAIVSFFGAAFMLWKKIGEVAPHVETFGEAAHTNFIADFFGNLRAGLIEAYQEAHAYLRPHAHDLVAGAASRAYKLSSWLAAESLKIHNFIQGRKVLRNTGNASVFIRDMMKDK